LLLLVVSIAFALVATRLLRYTVTSKKGLDEILTNRWQLTEAKARSTVAKLSAVTIYSLRAGNDRKAANLDRAHWLQLAGLALLAATVAAKIGDRGRCVVVEPTDAR